MSRAKKLYLAVGLGLVAMLVAAGAVFATVTFDPATGTGFVGKGDVQLAFGWNNAKLQSNASGVSFSYNSQDTYRVTSEFITGEGTPGEQTHEVTVPKKTTVNSTIAYDARVRNQINGFNLTGFSTGTSSGTVPQVGDDGIPYGLPGTVTKVELVSSTGGLYVNYGGTSVLLQ